MTQYRKKPVVIEAWQWHGEQNRTLLGSGAPDWLADSESVYGTFHPGKVRVVEETDGKAYLTIKTLEGEMTANPGDWIIKGVKGELYPCKPDIFAATYEDAATPPEAVNRGSAPDRKKLAAVIEHAMHGVEWTAGKRPSIADLEAILNSDAQPSIQILPDGSITAGEPREAAYKCADDIMALFSSPTEQVNRGSGEVTREALLCRELIQRIWSECDPSNWDHGLKKGNEYSAWKDATELFHQIGMEYWEELEAILRRGATEKPQKDSK